MQYKKLKEIAEIQNGVRIERYTENKTKQKIIKRTNKHNTPQIEYQNISQNINKKYHSQKNDIILQTTPPNTILKLDEKNIIIPMTHIIIRTKENHDPNYIFYLLKNKLIQKNKEIITEGSSLKIIKSNYLGEIKIPILPLKKQKKYGKILDLINKKTNLTTKTIELEKKIEKGILTKIMENENVKL